MILDFKIRMFFEHTTFPDGDYTKSTLIPVYNDIVTKTKQEYDKIILLQNTCPVCNNHNLIKVFKDLEGSGYIETELKSVSEPCFAGIFGTERTSSKVIPKTTGSWKLETKQVFVCKDCGNEKPINILPDTCIIFNKYLESYIKVKSGIPYQNMYPNQTLDMFNNTIKSFFNHMFKHNADISEVLKTGIIKEETNEIVWS